MRLVTYERGGVRRLGAWVAGTVVDLPDAVGHPAFPDSMESLVARNGGTTLDAAREALAQPDYVEECAIAGARLLAPILPASLLEFLGFEDDAKTSTFARGGGPASRARHESPAYREGSSRAILGPNEEFTWPPSAETLDYELEVACVVGRAGRDLSPTEAAAVIFGYTLMNGWTAGRVASTGVTPNRGAGKRTSIATSLGPCIVTPDELDPSDLAMVARVDGEEWSSGNLGAAGWSFPEMIAHLSRGRDVLPGDVFGSGTFDGGRGLDLGRVLEPGQVIELEAQGIGVLRNRIGDRPSGVKARGVKARGVKARGAKARRATSERPPTKALRRARPA